MNRLIHSIKVLFYTVKGYILGKKKQMIIANGEEMTLDDFIKRMAPEAKDCLVCKAPLKSGFGQVTKYHKYCRKFKNHRYGFDPKKVQL